jgi:uncharacterized protein
VLEVDEKRKRIALTMRLTDSAPQPGSQPEQRANRDDTKRLNQHNAQQNRQSSAPAPSNNAMASAFAKLRS